MVLFPYVISILLLWPDSSCHALSFTGLRPSGMYTLAYTQPSLWLVYCIISQIQRLTQARRFLGPLAYTDAQLLNAHAFVFLALIRFKCDSRNILDYRPFLPPGLIAPSGFCFVRGFKPRAHYTVDWRLHLLQWLYRAANPRIIS